MTATSYGMLPTTGFARHSVMSRRRPCRFWLMAQTASSLRRRAGDRFAVWGQGFGSWADWNSNDQVPGLDRSVGGFLIGGDAPFGENARMGALAGYSRTSIDEPDLGASADVDSYHLGIYGGAEFEALRLALGCKLYVACHRHRSSGSVHRIAGTSDRRLRRWNGTDLWRTWAMAFRPESIALEPFANLSYANLHLDSFAEKGGSAALAGASSDTDVTFTHARVACLKAIVVRRCRRRRCVAWPAGGMLMAMSHRYRRLHLRAWIASRYLACRSLGMLRWSRWGLISILRPPPLLAFPIAGRLPAKFRIMVSEPI